MRSLTLLVLSVIANPIRFFGHAASSHVLLVLDVLLDDRQRRPADSRDEIAVGPQRRQAALQPREFLSQEPRRSSFDQLDEPVNAELRVAFDQQVNVVGHNLDLKQLYLPLGADLRSDRFEAKINAIDQNLSSVFRTPDDVVFAIEGDAMVAPHQTIDGDEQDNRQGAYPSPALKGGGFR